MSHHLLPLSSVTQTTCPPVKPASCFDKQLNLFSYGLIPRKLPFKVLGRKGSHSRKSYDVAAIYAVLLWAYSGCVNVPNRFSTQHFLQYDTRLHFSEPLNYASFCCALFWAVAWHKIENSLASNFSNIIMLENACHRSKSSIQSQQA